MFKQFGGKISKDEKKRFSKSESWNGEKFLNIETTSMDISPLKMPKLLYKQFFENNGRKPKQKLPVAPFNSTSFLAPSKDVKFIWYGHSVVLLRVNGKTLLIDPMFGPNAAPISPIATKRFSENTLEIINDLPEIDIVLLTHDHYDHLDYESLQRLLPKVKNYYVALGCARHLIEWGVDAQKIQEFDWWDDQSFGAIKITFTPTRHFSGRGLTDRAKSLWGGWVIKTATENLYFTGDSGYGSHFKAVGDQLGPFDFAFVECGQYNQNWHLIHMFPEEGIQAAKDARIARIMPVHWAGFALAQHTWTDPVERFIAEATKQNIPFSTPKLGELFTLKAFLAQNNWWEDYK
tara:strand:+ start:728 stop:1771 length:1044 start_codon:yes stop_codon:yes gene_type:complete